MGNNRRRKRMRTQRLRAEELSPEKPEQGHTLTEEPRDREKEIRLELQSLDKGWVIGSDEHQRLREALMAKAVKIGLSMDTDDKTVLQALRVVSNAELRQQAVRLQSLPKDLPEPVQVNTQVNIDQPKPFEIAQKLLQSREVRQVITGGRLDADDQAEK